jgi:hypothetical protein
MSVYFVQKLFYHLNVDPKAKKLFQTDPDASLADYRLTPQEIRAIKETDLVGLYRMGVHPLLLRPFATLKGIGNAEYRKALAALAEGN